MVELVVRLVFSLAVVIGMLLLLARFSAKRFRGSANAPIKVVHRQALSRSSSVAVVTIGSRVLVLGTTEQQVALLTELDPEELEVMDPTLESELDEPVAAPVAAPVVVPAAVEVAANEPAPVEPVFEPVAFQPVTFQPVTAPAPVAPAAVAPAAVVTKARPAKKKPTQKKAVRAAVPAADGPLAGSLLSAQTWKQALAAATGRGMDLS